jgi:ABC-2 type transport system permease protein
LRAEWTKLRTLPGTGWLLLALFALTVAVSAAAAATACPRAHCAADPVKTSLTGVAFGQAIAAIVAVQAIGGEHGMLSLTFAALPKRIRVLAAKACLVTGQIAVAGGAAVGTSLLVGRMLLPDGLTQPSTGAVVRAALGSVGYLVLIGLLSLGIAAGVRDSASSVGAVLGLLYVLPIVASTLSDPDWRRHLEQVSPMSAGLAIQATRELSELPIKPWAGLGVLALWSVTALVVGGTVLKRGDA